MDNVALLSVDNFLQHLNAVHFFFFFFLLAQTLTQNCSQIHLGPLQYMKRPNF